MRRVLADAATAEYHPCMKELFEERVHPPVGEFVYLVPRRVRMQVVLLLTRKFDDVGVEYRNEFFEDVWWHLSERLGTTLPGLDDKNLMMGVFAVINKHPNPDVVLSAIELICRRTQGRLDRAPETSESNDVIDEINDYLRRSSVGYVFNPTASEIVRIESQHLNETLVAPTFLLLQQPDLAGADHEYKKAHGHLRAGLTKEATNEALKAVESAMKTICTRRSIDYSSARGTKDLLRLLIDNGVAPASLDSYLTGLRSALESGLPTLRNKRAGHGQGPEIQDMTMNEASLAVNLAGATLLFLVRAEEESRK
jgi:hypothetical protein